MQTTDYKQFTPPHKESVMIVMPAYNEEANISDVVGNGIRSWRNSPQTAWMPHWSSPMMVLKIILGK